jgi:EAL domain-containing protein (putative c-di-GMP-specific phosphodiesterase class I)/CheY-like chemotaxis protein
VCRGLRSAISEVFKLKATILIADDDATFVDAIKLILSVEGYTVISALNGRQALDSINVSKPDLILLDITMPDMSGWEVCKKLKSMNPSTPVLLISGKDEIKDKLMGIQVGADDYLTKPFEAETLLERIEEHLHTKKGLAEATAVQPLRSERTMLYDAITGQPTVPVVLEQLRVALEGGCEVGIFYVDLLEQYCDLELGQGWEFIDRVQRTMSQTAQDFCRKSLKQLEPIVAASRVGSTSFYIFLRTCKGQRIAPGEMDEITVQLKTYLRTALEKKLPRQLSSQILFFAGYSIVSFDPLIRFERQIYRGMKQAMLAASSEEEQRHRVLNARLLEIIRRGEIKTHYQPIVKLDTGKVHGYEALSRGPLDSPFSNPEIMFAFARESELTWALEQICFKLSCSALEKIDGDKKLFVNIEANVLGTKSFSPKQLLDLFPKCPSQVVLEITERKAIEDFNSFRKISDELHSMGFSIALDDVGAGYASLQAIAEIQPDYIKIAGPILHGLDTEPIKRNLVSMLCNLSTSIDASLIAENIESQGEYDCCRELGIPYGQGFFLGRPNPEILHY